MLDMSLMKYARVFAFILLAVVTVYGAYSFFTGDWAAAAEFWRGKKLAVIPLVALLATADVLLEAIGWMWVYHRFRIQAFDRGGMFSYLASRAGLLLPAQMGRLIRPDAMVRLGRGTLSDCLKAEAVAFVLDSTSVFGLLAALLAFKLRPMLAPVAALAVIAVVLFLGNRVAKFLSGTRLELPMAFWWQWSTLAIVLIEMVGWIAHGVALFVVIRDLPGDFTLLDSLLYAPGSAVLGVATGLPGGIGATEGLLGASLRLMHIPSEHLVLAVGAFRLLTFWIWIPIGWLALGAVRRMSRGRSQALQAEGEVAGAR
jgi:uncharacterized membrane protein YbhN (UPF0104 family)